MDEIVRWVKEQNLMPGSESSRSSTSKPLKPAGASKGRSAAALERRKERNKIIARNARVRKKAEFSHLSDQFERLQSENKKLRQCLLANLPSEMSEKIFKELEEKRNSAQQHTSVAEDLPIEYESDQLTECKQEEARDSSPCSESSALVPSSLMAVDADAKPSGQLESSATPEPTLNDQAIAPAAGKKVICNMSDLGIKAPAVNTTIGVFGSSVRSNTVPIIEDNRHVAPISPWPIISGGITDILQVAEDMDRLYPQMDIKFPKFPTPRFHSAEEATSGIGTSTSTSKSRTDTNITKVVADPMVQRRNIHQVLRPMTGSADKPREAAKGMPRRDQPAAHSASFFNSYNIPSFFMGM